VRRLDTLLREHYPAMTGIDILVIDVEGWEVNVLRGLDLSRYRPRLIILEDLFEEGECADVLEVAGSLRWMRFAPNEIWMLVPLRRRLC
jgi:Methyltransferase FkbM domain